MHDMFGSVRHKVKIFAPKCSAEISVYKSMQNMCKWVKCCLLNIWKWLHISKTVHRHTDEYTR